jgi:uncharacterized protein YndB with AHSA1/START domain
MATDSNPKGTPTQSPTTERTSAREFVVRHTVQAPAERVFAAWTERDRFVQWWVPKSCGFTLLSCEMDVHVGGTYRLVFPHGDATMAFFGTYREVTSPKRLVWTNEEGGESEVVVTTVTLEEADGQTIVTVHDLYPSSEALDTAIECGATAGMPESLTQLDAFLT